MPIRWCPTERWGYRRFRNPLWELEPSQIPESAAQQQPNAPTPRRNPRLPARPRRPPSGSSSRRCDTPSLCDATAGLSSPHGAPRRKRRGLGTPTSTGRRGRSGLREARSRPRDAAEDAFLVVCALAWSAQKRTAGVHPGGLDAPRLLVGPDVGASLSGRGASPPASRRSRSRSTRRRWGSRGSSTRLRCAATRSRRLRSCTRRSRRGRGGRRTRRRTRRADADQRRPRPGAGRRLGGRRLSTGSGSRTTRCGLGCAPLPGLLLLTAVGVLPPRRRPRRRSRSRSTRAASRPAAGRPVCLPGARCRRRS